MLNSQKKSGDGNQPDVLNIKMNVSKNEKLIIESLRKDEAHARVLEFIYKNYSYQKHRADYLLTEEAIEQIAIFCEDVGGVEASNILLVGLIENQLKNNIVFNDEQIAEIIKLILMLNHLGHKYEDPEAIEVS
jgi:hypothetical protein